MIPPEFASEASDLREFFYRVKLFFEHTDKQRWTRAAVLRELQKAEIEWEMERSARRLGQKAGEK